MWSQKSFQKNLPDAYLKNQPSLVWTIAGWLLLFFRTSAQVFSNYYFKLKTSPHKAPI
jgi:hypothetical protein